MVVDKPFTITSGDALALIDVASQTGKMLSVFQNRRYVTDFITIAEILKKYAGHGSQLRGALSSLSPRSKTKCMAEEPDPGSGILYDLGAHIIDQALYLFRVTKNITADVRLQRPHARTVDNFEVQLITALIR